MKIQIFNDAPEGPPGPPGDPGLFIPNNRKGRRSNMSGTRKRHFQRGWYIVDSNTGKYIRGPIKTIIGCEIEANKLKSKTDIEVVYEEGMSYEV